MAGSGTGLQVFTDDDTANRISRMNSGSAQIQPNTDT